jgi:uncharacterized damage-inducible protein DinB
MSLRVTFKERMMVQWAGEPWHGKSSKALLADITAEEASRRVFEGVQTIWETVHHMLAWTEEVTTRLGGAGAGTPARGDWPTVTDTSAQAWEATQEALRTARYALLEAVDKSHEEDFYLQVSKAANSTGHGVTKAQTLTGLIDHDIYHLGQIAMLKKALRRSSARSAGHDGFTNP